MLNLDAAFAALADPTRRAILARLALGETTINELAEPFKNPQQSFLSEILQLRFVDVCALAQRDAQTVKQDAAQRAYGGGILRGAQCLRPVDFRLDHIGNIIQPVTGCQREISPARECVSKGWVHAAAA